MFFQKGAHLIKDKKKIHKNAFLCNFTIKNIVDFIHLVRVQTTFNDSIEFFCYSIILEKVICT